VNHYVSSLAGRPEEQPGSSRTVQSSDMVVAGSIAHLDEGTEMVVPTIFRAEGVRVFEQQSLNPLANSWTDHLTVSGTPVLPSLFVQEKPVASVSHLPGSHSPPPFGFQNRSTQAPVFQRPAFPAAGTQPSQFFGSVGPIPQVSTVTCAMPMPVCESFAPVMTASLFQGPAVTRASALQYTSAISEPILNAETFQSLGPHKPGTVGPSASSFQASVPQGPAAPMMSASFCQNPRSVEYCIPSCTSNWMTPSGPGHSLVQNINQSSN